MKKKTKILLACIIVALLIFAALKKFQGENKNDRIFTPQNQEAAEKKIIQKDDYIAARPDPEFDYFTWTLPTGASLLRLSLPADIDDFLLGEEGYIGGFGMSGGEHIEGLDHVWINLKKGTPVKSWADGVVTDIRYYKPHDEYAIEIDYGQNLVGIHGEVAVSYIKIGDHVKRGEEIGVGVSNDAFSGSAEFTLIDRGRFDSIKAYETKAKGRGGSLVSPFDYLKSEEKRLLVDAYKKKVIEPFINDGTIAGASTKFKPEQPYLTNEFLFPPENEKFYNSNYKGALTGAWLLISSDWEYGHPNDLLTLIEADNPYFKGNTIKAIDDSGPDWGTDILFGIFEADYVKKQIKITQGKDYVKNKGHVYYGIFEIDESGERTKLKIEYQDNSYPKEFSGNALTYVRRSSYDRRYDAQYILGVYEYKENN